MLKAQWAFFKLGILTNLEYRLNFIVDAILQPLLTSAVEILLWIALFKNLGTETLSGFPKENYLSYIIWGTFLGRVTISWMYEHMMMEEIETGSINSFIVRPVTFFEYYLGQLLGYKLVATLVSSLIPIGIALLFELPTFFDRLIPAFIFVFYYLIFVHTLSFCVACLGFFLNRVRSFTIAKNLSIFILSGELFPLDLLPEFWKKIFLALPFCNGVYIPVGYITGRLDSHFLINGIYSTTWALVIGLIVAYVLWTQGLRRYSGTGA